MFYPFSIWQAIIFQTSFVHLIRRLPLSGIPEIENLKTFGSESSQILEVPAAGNGLKRFRQLRLRWIVLSKIYPVEET